jgi:hypothetical protein
MNYFNSTEIDPASTNITVPTAASSSSSSSSSTTTTTVINPVNKDLSDWRNIQLGQAPTLFDPFWMQTTVNAWHTPTTPVYPSTYNIPLPAASSSTRSFPWTNSTSNQPWSTPTFPTGPSLTNFNVQHHFPSPDLLPNVIDLTTNPPANFNTPIRFDLSIVRRSHKRSSHDKSMVIHRLHTTQHA